MPAASRTGPPRGIFNLIRSLQWRTAQQVMIRGSRTSRRTARSPWGQTPRRVETHASALPPVRLPPHQTVRADFPHTAFHRVLWILSFLRLCCVLYAFFLSSPRPPHVRPREAEEALPPTSAPAFAAADLPSSRAELSERAMSLCPVPSGAPQNDFGASVLASAIMTHLATGDLSVRSFEAYIRDFTFVWLIPL